MTFSNGFFVGFCCRTHSIGKFQSPTRRSYRTNFDASVLRKIRIPFEITKKFIFLHCFFEKQFGQESWVSG